MLKAKGSIPFISNFFGPSIFIHVFLSLFIILVTLQVETWVSLLWFILISAFTEVIVGTRGRLRHGIGGDLQE